jgi:predicted esterase
MSHGTDDKMISVSEARSAKQYLSVYSQNIDYNEYKDGHTIIMKCLMILYNG